MCFLVDLTINLTLISEFAQRNMSMPNPNTLIKCFISLQPLHLSAG